ncbi:MAG: hypothetical protein IPO81_07865 [Kouleothrix sp.]|nr:hypothetical protein [Kouleothrix sp.]
MTVLNDAAPDRSELVYRYHERLYRLALLAAGDPGAAEALLERAYRQLPADLADAEATLTARLLTGRAARRWGWSPGPAAIERAALDRSAAAALLGALSRLTSAARLMIGLFYIGGLEPTEIAERLGPSAGDQPVAEVLARFRIDAARALGRVPADADAGQLMLLDRWAEGLLAEDESVALRRDVLALPELRDLRDGLAATREQLPRVIPALFAAVPSRQLTERLLQIAQQSRRRTRVPQVSTRRAQALLALGVLVIAAAIVLVPSLLARRVAPTAQRSLSVEQLIDGAIHRFDRAPDLQGVLHEQYRVERGGQPAYLVERWYDYATPNRLAINVKEEGRERGPVVQISSDGRSLVQFRGGYRSVGRRFALDAHVSESEARAALQLLRGQPLASSFGRDTSDPGDPGPLYLAQARASGASFLGQTTLLGRPAFLLTYRTSEPPALDQQPSAGQPVRVALTIDAQTYALLDVAVFADSDGEGAARHPVQALQVELLASVPDERFKLASGSNVIQRTGLASVRFPFIGDSQFLTLEAAARRAPSGLLAPQQLPDAQMRGLAVAAGGGSGSEDGPVILLYEGEFQNVLLLPNTMSETSSDVGEEQTAGEFRYRIVSVPGYEGGLSALVYRPGAPDQRVLMILNDELATGAERETRLQALIASLTPVDEQTLPVLGRNFYPPSGAAGKS